SPRPACTASPPSRPRTSAPSSCSRSRRPAPSSPAPTRSPPARPRRGAAARRARAGRRPTADPATAAALARAKARLDGLELYARPVDVRRVRVLVVPWLFRLPWFRRFDGYAAWPLILLRRPLGALAEAEDLL